MNSLQIFENKQDLANEAAKRAVDILQEATLQYGSATWVLAGGTTPELAYKVIATTYLDSLDWSKVMFVMGDERIAPLTSSDNNWHAAEAALLRHIPDATFLRPKSDQSAEVARDDYIMQLESLPKNASGQPRLDLVWLGVGEDGHTLSLFPGHPDFTQTDRLVAAVHNSPKPPSNRISLTLHALMSAEHCDILAAGEGKADALSQALQPDNLLPIAQAARATSASWLIDTTAASRLT